MIIRRYKGKTLEALRETVVKEMGDSAVIIHTQKISENGIMGKLKGNSYEIIAAVEDPLTGGMQSTGNDLPVEEILSSQKDQYLGIRRSMKMMDDKLASLDHRFEELNKKEAATKSLSGPLKNVHQQWHSKLHTMVDNSATANNEEWRDALAKLTPTAGVYFRQTGGNVPDIYALAGPTGVGKTTTLAKLAAQAVLKNKLNVGLITLDTYRVAAVDQLREYSKLLGTELAVVFSAKELQQQIERFHNKALVLIDSQGRGPFDNEGIDGIARILTSIPSINTILTLPAGVRKEDAVSISNSFKCLNPTCMIITKIDEASCFDGLTTLIYHANIPVIYTTNGQRVPEDIQPASPGLISALIVGDNQTTIY